MTTTQKIIYTLLAVTAISTSANAHSDNAYDYARFHEVQKGIDYNSMRNAQRGATGRWFIRSLYGLFDAKTPRQEFEEQQRKIMQLQELRVRQIIIDNQGA